MEKSISYEEVHNLKPNTPLIYKGGVPPISGISEGAICRIQEIRDVDKSVVLDYGPTYFHVGYTYLTEHFNIIENETMSLEKYEIPLDYEFLEGDRLIFLKKNETFSSMFRTDVEYEVEAVRDMGKKVTLKLGAASWTLFSIDVRKYFRLSNRKEEELDRVNHPSHYTWLKDKCGIEVIDITRHMDFCLGNAIKYILRAGHKKEASLSDTQKEIEDLRKAIWYINDRIEQLTDRQL